MDGGAARSSGPLLCWMVFSLFSCAAATYSYAYQPRFVVQNGHLEIVGAEGRNITIRSSTGGFINLNGENLVHLVAQAKAATRIVETIGVENSATYLETTLSSHQEFTRRLNALERLTSNFNSSLGPSQSINRFVDRRLRLILRRVNRLESFMNEFRRTIIMNECISSPCQNGGTCMDMYNDILCLCPPNWQGKYCQVDTNECSQFAGTELGCQNGASCVNTPGSYRCNCVSGWYGIHCTLKSDNCSSSSTQELCGNGICVPQSTTPGYTCICNTGWTKENGGTSCTKDINECAAYKPACSHDPPVPCINTPGSFTCGSCPQGYTGNGYYCSDINECLINNGGCSMSPYVPCINTRGSRTCGSCPPGFQGDGTTCTQRGVCEINNGGCHPMARCFENPRISQSYVECICLSGYTGNGLGPAGCRPLSPGETNVILGDPCSSQPCQNGGTCIAPSPSSLSCICAPGFTGIRCERRSDPCQSHPCQNEGICVASSNTTGFSCLCQRGYTGEHCQTLQQACGGTLRGLTGILQFPAAGTEKYPHSSNCAWLLVTNRTQVLNITFTKFHLEESPSCQYDWLQIHDGRGAGDHMIGRFCGSNKPKGGNIISTRNALYLWFRSDHSVDSDGFEVLWNSINPVCGGRIETNSHGSVQSPGSPGTYPINRDCYWQLIVPLGNRIQLNFYTLQIEAHPNCSYDFLEIRDGLDPTSPLLNKYCNSTLPAPIVTSGSHALLYFHSDESASDYGFQLTFSKVPGIPGCGGLHTTPSGEIISPNSPNDYSHNVNCQWIIRVPIGERVKIIFTRFNVEDSRGCRFDFVEIRDGNDETSPLMSRLCGNIVPRPLVSSGNTIMIQFTTDASVSGKGFHLRYETDCGGLYSELSGVFHSPYYPNPYPGNRECIYHISLPQAKAIKLSFQDLEIEENTQCMFDYLEVRDGDFENSTLIGKYCGGAHTLPALIVSSFNHLWIKFKTDSSVSKRGFMANYTAIDLECGGILTEQNGALTSPTHPDQYPPNLDCIWVIRGEPGQVVQLTWRTFSLEDHESCNLDYIQIFDNSSVSGGVLMGRYCGSELPPVLRSVENVMTVMFHSDYSISHDGFSAQYTFIDGSTICGGTYFATVGVLQSPGYPNMYSPNKDCTWIIQVPTGQQIKLNVTEFDLETSSPCSYDYLELRNGGQTTSPLIGKFCGNIINRQITSMGNQLYIRFVSDSSVNSKGFKITWDGTSTGCGGTLTSATGSIQSPNYPHSYGRNAECTWKISVSKGSKISIAFVDLDLEEEHSCRYDYVEIRDGPDVRGKLLGTYCSGHPLPFVSSSDQLWIKFRSDQSNQGRGFVLRYATDCNVEVKGYRGVIESPNFPDSYPSSQDCTWKIIAPNGNLLNITFSHFHLENSSNSGCAYDFVEIKEGPNTEEGSSSSIGKYCGTNLPPPISSTMPRISVHFKTDVSVAHNGFRLEWVVNGCGGILTKPVGQFTSPGYPKGYPLSTTCIWSIQVAWGRSIEITVENMDLERSRGCYFDSLQIYGGPDEKSPKLLNACHLLNNSLVVTTSGNNAYVVFETDQSYGGRGFSASYKTVNSLCGGNFTAPFGSIHSRNYPQNYENVDECYWLIKVDRSHIIKLYFIEFDVEAYGNCSSDYVNVFDGEDESGRMLLHHCGTSLPSPQTLYSTGNSLLIRMRTDSSTAAKGFLANYTITCGARIVVESEGELEASSALEHSNLRNNTCTWTLVAARPGDQITLTVSHLAEGALGEIPEVNCMIDYLKVHDGSDASSPLIDKYCGSALPHHITSTGSALYIIYSYSYIFTTTPFKAFYSVLKTACGGQLRAEHGAFATPGIPGSYPSNAECIWTINTSPGNKAMVSFRSLDVEASSGCDKDYVEIREGDSAGTLMGVYCGNSIPDNITASSRFWIKFRSDENGTGLGFVADYSMLHGNEVFGAHGQIASPLYPEPFISTGTYTWRITVNHGMAIAITFEDFHVDSYPGECHLSLKLLDGYDESAPVLFEDCDYNSPPPLTSSSNVVYIVWNVQPIRVGSWFSLNWLQVPRELTSTPAPANTSLSIPGCGGIFTAQTNGTVFTSPGYPNGYAGNLDCEWIFETTPYNHIKILVNDMNLQPSPYCSVADSLMIYDGKGGHQEWELLKTYCLPNASREDPVKGSNIVKVVFHSDRFRNGTGFSAVAAADCGGSLKGPNGIIDAHNLNSSALSSRMMWMECAWDITVKAGRTIVVEFDEFDIFSVDPHCGDSYILFRNGGTSSSPYLGNGKYCGTQAPSVPETIGNHMFIKYSATAGTKGFKLRYREKSLSCGGHMTLTSDMSSFVINSPNYPNIPPPHIECKWVFLAPAGEMISLDFLERFDLTASYKCKKAYVEIRDGGTENAEVLGSFCLEKPGTVSSTGNIMFVKYFTDAQEPRNGFKANISIAKCGGILRGESGVLTSPHYPAPYPSNTECKWTIEGPQYGVVRINFSVVDFPRNNNCSSTDHIVVTEKAYIFRNELSATTVRPPMPFTTSDDDDDYEYEDEEEIEIRQPVNQVEERRRILAVICGSSVPSPIEASSNQVEVKLVSRGGSSGFKGFSLTFDNSMESCGGRLEGMPSGILESPGYPNSIAHLRVCVWHISVPQGRRIRVEFQDLDLAGNAPYCSQRLAFFNGEGFSNLIKILCGQGIPQPIESSSNTMMVYFWPRYASNHRGFRATYSSDLPTVCEGDLSSSSGIITSPRVANMSVFFCTWERRENSPSNYTLSLTLLNSQIGEAGSGTCRYNPTSLIITNGDSVPLDEFCGNYTTQIITANPYPITKIMARQGLKRRDRGGVSNFTLQYSVSRCGGVLVGPNEVLTSPNYPQEYPPNVDCAWALNYPEGQQIKLKVTNMSLENNCLNDYVQVRNGGSPKSPLIGLYCGTNIPDAIISQSNQLWVFFHSNIMNQGRGFRIETEAVIGGCGGVYHGKTGNISSPNYPRQYDNNAECLWEINVEQGYHIGLVFIERFQLEGTGSCSQDFVEIFNYGNETWQTMGKVCGRNIPGAFNSTGNRMKVLFRSSASTKGDGFKAQWTVNCGGVINNKKGVLFSPGYPGLYGDDLLCTYIINTPGENLMAEFQEFKLEKETTCKYDNLTIYAIENRGQSPRQFGPYCGTDKPPVIRGYDSIRLVFQTDTLLRDIGFLMKYRVETCGGFINSPKMIESPTYDSVYYGGLNCTWVIEAPANKVVALVFEYFILEGSGTCLYDHVSVYDSSYIDPGKRLARLCGNLTNEPPAIRSTSPKMTVQFSSDSSVHLKGFKASVSFTYGESIGCGGTKTIPRDGSLTLSSPRLTQSNNHYEPFLDCHWLIIGAPQQILSIDFKEMDLISCPAGAKSDCGCDSLEIRDGAGPFSDLIGKYCGSTVPPTVTSSSNQMWIRFVTDGFGNGQGFQLDIRSVASPCGPEQVFRVTNRTQVLKSPNYPNNYPNNLRCHWLLISEEQMFRFDIHFKDMDIEDSENCDDDRLEIFDSDFAGTNAEGYGENFIHRGKIEYSFSYASGRMPWYKSRFCGVGHPSDFYSGTNKVEINFITNSANTSRGFELEFQLAGCNRNFTREQGRILNAHSEKQDDCLITIQAQPNHTISLYFNDFRMVSGDDSALGMEIRDGLSANSQVIGQFSGHVIPSPVFSTSSAVSIRIMASSHWAMFSYDMTYVTTDKGRGCGGRLFNYGGKFTSPMYPMNVRNATNCRWEVTVPVGLWAYLRFLSFDLGSRNTCDTDYVNVYDVDKLTKAEILRSRFCGGDNPAAVLGSSNTLIVQSVTSFNNAGTGWVIAFAAVREGLFPTN
ncbi:cubilin-like [Ischnura elegans]|uniref:cubilin-like n=1 Tax=Ischnura elegans TaxID=197161 RepID=UPI001ED8737C|nr:cubilin-like [Ischnura elegans]